MDHPEPFDEVEMDHPWTLQEEGQRLLRSTVFRTLIVLWIATLIVNEASKVIPGMPEFIQEASRKENSPTAFQVAGRLIEWYTEIFVMFLYPRVFFVVSILKLVNFLL